MGIDWLSLELNHVVWKFNTECILLSHDFHLTCFMKVLFKTELAQKKEKCHLNFHGQNLTYRCSSTSQLGRKKLLETVLRILIEQKQKIWKTFLLNLLKPE